MYTIMSKNNPVCEFNDSTGEFKIINSALMPINLFLSDLHGTISEKISNINSFNDWCADRVLSIDRRYAKKILNELGLSQSQSNGSKAQISKSYHSLSLQDSFWLKKEGEGISWKEINLFNNHFSEALIPVALHGGSATIQNKKWTDISQELSTNGTYAKAWGRIGDAIVLYKADDIEGDETLRETKASSILDCFEISHVVYSLGKHDGKRVSICECMTSEDYSIVPFRHFKQWCAKNNKNPIEEVKKIDSDGYYKMNIITYLIGNDDNHDGNWGFYRNNITGELECLHPLFDFNCAFHNYKEKDGGWCLPEDITYFDFEDIDESGFEHTKTLKEAALEGMEHVVIKQKYPVVKEMFLSDEDFSVFQNRCNELGINLVMAKCVALEQNINEKVVEQRFSQNDVDANGLSKYISGKNLSVPVK